RPHPATLALPLLLAALPGAAPERPALPPPAPHKVDYARDVKPILAANCYRCHGEKKQRGEYRLDREADAFKGGEKGRAIIAAKGADSPLLPRVAGLDPERVMPPSGERLTAGQVAVLRAWIDQGAAWPDDLAGPDPRAWWSLLPLARPPLPKLAPSPQ